MPSSTIAIRTSPWYSALPFVVVGTICIVAGGMVAATIAPHPTTHGLWAIAYLVLVPGVFQIGLGICQSWLTDGGPSQRTVWLELIVFNVANALVVIGVLADTTLITDIGIVLFLISLEPFFFAPKSSTPWRGAAFYVFWIYRLLIAILVISAPIGLVLAHS